MKRNAFYMMMSAALAASLSMPVMADETPVENQKDRTMGQVIDDMSIATRTKAALAADEVTDAIKIDVEVDRDTVQLNGFVDTEEERQQAERIAANIEGVATVKNNLELQPRDRTTGEYIDDKMLIAKVKTALADDPTVESMTIDIESDQGVISLGGHVDTNEERVAALKSASKVAGVVRVIDNIDVRS